MDFDETSNIVYAACHEDGRIYSYSLGANLRNDIHSTKVFSLSGAVNPRVLKLIKVTNQMLIGYKNGIIAMYDLDVNSGPICILIRFSENS